VIDINSADNEGNAALHYFICWWLGEVDGGVNDGENLLVTIRLFRGAGMNPLIRNLKEKTVRDPVEDYRREMLDPADTERVEEMIQELADWELGWRNSH
jgi:hypothetical protein